MFTCPESQDGFSIFENPNWESDCDYDPAEQHDDYDYEPSEQV